LIDVPLTCRSHLLVVGSVGRVLPTGVLPVLTSGCVQDMASFVISMRVFVTTLVLQIGVLLPHTHSFAVFT